MTLVQRDELAVVPFVTDATHATNADAAPAGVAVFEVGAPSDGQVPTFSAALGYHVPQTPSGGGSTSGIADQALSSALAVEASARLRIDGVTATVDEQQVAYLAQFYGA